MTARYAAIILAAGRSTRMEQFKPLLSLGEETMVERVISIFSQNGCDVVIVVGWNKEALIQSLRNRPVSVAENPNFERGMLTSIRAGIRSLAPEHQAFFVMPVDIPLVRPATICRLIEAADSHPDKIIFPAFSDHRGHPPLIPAQMADSILHWPVEGGLNTFLDTERKRARIVEVPDRHILFDIDTAEDYAEAAVRLSRYEIPTAAECDVIINSICHMPENICRHCRKVCDIALDIGRCLARNGREIDLVLLRAAALLHDAARLKPDHANAAAKMLRDLGFAKLGDIVAAHTDLKQSDGRPASPEAKILFLADKLVEGDRMVSLEERYRTWNRRFDVTPELADKILQGKNRAKAVKQEFESLLDCKLEDIIGV